MASVAVSASGSPAASWPTTYPSRLISSPSSAGKSPLQRGSRKSASSPPGSRSVLGYFNLSHNGRVAHFVSHMSVYPELGTGIFVTTDSSLGGRLTRSLSEHVLTRYFPARETSAAPARRGAKQSLSEYAGSYRTTRRSYTKLEAIFDVSSVLRVDATRDGFLTWQTGVEPPVRFAMIARDLFQAVDGDSRIAFVRDAHGAVTQLIGDAISYDPSGFFDSHVWLNTACASGLIVTLAILADARRRRRQRIVLETQGQRRSSRSHFRFCSWPPP
jgi:hypothetical protein